jgi:HEAT repeat protein
MNVNFFNTLLKSNIPVWAVAVCCLIIIGLGIFIFLYIRSRVFKVRLRRITKAQDAHGQDSEQAEEALKVFMRSYPPEKLAHYSRRMERYVRKMGPQVIIKTGLADRWIQKLAHSPNKTDLRRVILYCSKTALFKAFLAAEKHSNLKKFFLNWMQNEGLEKVFRLLAESCRGEAFNPVFFTPFLETHGELIRELTSEPEWYARYFAYKILLLEGTNTLTERSLDDGLLDPHPLIRKVITEKFTAEADKTWTALWEKLIHDPVFEVREAARNRIAKEFHDRYNPNVETLNPEETAHILELLDPVCQEDRTFAMNMLENQNKELRYPAAVFLEKCGDLESILVRNMLDDQGGIDYSVKLLLKALEVNVSGFLQRYSAGNGASLLVAANLLSAAGGTSCGTQDNICYLQEKVFTFFNTIRPDPANRLIYTLTLEVAAARGNIKALELFANELSRRENDLHFLELLLPRIPNSAASFFLPILFRFMENTAFSARPDLERIIGTFAPDQILPYVFTILNADRVLYPHIVRISALKILCRLRQPFCLQRILESLPTITQAEAKEIASLISEYPKNVFNEKAAALLALPDAKIRASLITILPELKNDSFKKEIRSSLKDVDPDVRIAAIKALLGFDELKLINQETSMLHDPIERVRTAAAEVISIHGNPAAMKILVNIINDTNETDVVKEAVIEGLGLANNAESISMLITVLDTKDELRKQAETALAQRTVKRDIIQLLEIFKDAEPQLREKLIPVFKAQGRKAEPFILEILKDEIASLKPYLVSILEETGYVDELKRRLSNRNAPIRREAALMLSLLDTLPAFRGLVLAAKDPDQEVRVCVVKALERLNNAQSRDILETLKKDPDNHIRKYTHWALERLDTLAME